MVDINGLRCYIHTEMACCETGDNPSMKVLDRDLRCYIHTEMDCCETGDNPSLKALDRAKGVRIS